MAKLLVTFLLLFFFVVAFSNARDLADRSENEIPVQDSESKEASIFLPSEKLFESETQPEPESTTDDSEQEISESRSSEISETLGGETSKSDSQPLIMITFRPINRHFSRRLMPSFIRRGRHRCHHHKHAGSGEISYNLGNDMILSDEESSVNPDREIPMRWNKFRQVGVWDSYGSERKNLHHLHHHHFHRHHEDMEEKEEIEANHKHEEKNGFLKSFRKFLNQFEF